jgi:hypothetical protein
MKIVYLILSLLGFWEPVASFYIQFSTSLDLSGRGKIKAFKPH